MGNFHPHRQRGRNGAFVLSRRRRADKVLRVEWGRRGLLGNITRFFRNKDEAVPIVQLTTGAQQADFEMMIDAVLRILVPPLLEKLVQRLQAGQTVVVGPCTLSNAGVAFSIGVLFQTDYMLPWRDVDTQTERQRLRLKPHQPECTSINVSKGHGQRGYSARSVLPCMREQRSQQAANTKATGFPTTRKAFLAWMSIPAVIVIIAIVVITSTKTSRTLQRRQRRAVVLLCVTICPSAPLPTVRHFPQDTPASESKTVYRVPSVHERGTGQGQPGH